MFVCKLNISVLIFAIREYQTIRHGYVIGMHQNCLLKKVGYFVSTLQQFKIQ